MVMENRRGVEEERLHKLLSQAVRMPPLVPTVGTRTKLLFRLGGRKVLALRMRFHAVWSLANKQPRALPWRLHREQFCICPGCLNRACSKIKGEIFDC